MNLATKPQAVDSSLSTSAKRNFRPRPPVTVAPVAISTENSLALVGLTPRKLRELLDRHPEIPRVRVGHTVIVQADHFRALLERLESSGGEDADLPPIDSAEDHGQPMTCAEVLAQLKRRKGTR